LDGLVLDQRFTGVKAVAVTSVRLASLPLPPRAAPIHHRKPVSHGGAIRPIVIDKETAGKVAGDGDRLPHISSMRLECPVLVVGSGVPAFKAEHVVAALKARGVSGYWLVELKERPGPSGSGALAETLVGFPGLHIERIASPSDL
jgi:hypothetical protein